MILQQTVREPPTKQRIALERIGLIRLSGSPSTGSWMVYLLLSPRLARTTVAASRSRLS